MYSTGKAKRKEKEKKDIYFCLRNFFLVQKQKKLEKMNLLIATSFL